MNQNLFDEIGPTLAAKQFSRKQLLKAVGAGVLLSGPLGALWADPASATTLAVSPIKQNTTGSCARACVVMVLRYHGYNLGIDDAAVKQALPDFAHITNHVAPSFGKLTNNVRVGEWFKADATTWLSYIRSNVKNAGKPLVALIPNGTKLGHTFTRGHYVVIHGLDASGNVQFADPWMGTKFPPLRIYSQSQFATAWGTGSNDAMPWQGVRTRYTLNNSPLFARHSRKVVDVSGHSYADGAKAQQWTYLNFDNQKFRIEALGNGYSRIVALHSGKVLDVYGYSYADGAPIHQWTWLGNHNQQFRVDLLGEGYYRFMARHSGKVMDVYGYSYDNGAQIHQWTWLGNNNQKFSAFNESPPLLK